MTYLTILKSLLEDWGVSDVMKSTEEAVERLEIVASRLRERGAPDLADEVGTVIEHLAHVGEPSPADLELVASGEAAALLGVRSINTIKKWAIDGLLDGYRRGGRIMVTRASIERMRAHPTVAAERAFAAKSDAAWAPFETDGRDLPPPTTVPGRKPWER